MKAKTSNIILKIITAIFIFSPILVIAAGLVPCDGPNCDFDKFMELIFGVINFLVQLGIAFSAIVFAYAGWLYMTSGGDEGKISQAHELFVKVLWGFLFALGGYLIVQLIAKSLGVQGGYIIF